MDALLNVHPDVDVALQLLGALVAGGAVGLERSVHGRAARFRTFSLVALASCRLIPRGGHDTRD